MQSVGSQGYILFLFYFILWLCHTAFRTLVPWPGIKRGPEVKALSPNPWAAMEFPRATF